jgi:hypothetical protein
MTKRRNIFIAFLILLHMTECPLRNQTRIPTLYENVGGPTKMNYLNLLVSPSSADHTTPRKKAPCSASFAKFK